MTTQDLFKCVKWLLGLCLMMFAMASCTNDYFVDETNFRLYVPQIKEGTIDNFYVAFHDKTSGAHALTRRVEKPFDKDDFIKNGILRFKLPFGEYNVTCFANASTDELTSGQNFDNSYAMQKLRQQGNIYDAHTTDPRVVMTSATAYPIGHPSSMEALEVDMTDSRRVKGRVTIKCIGLPTTAKYIDTYYTGLSTRYNFSSQLTRFSEQDHLFSGRYEVGTPNNNTVTLSVNTVMPSAGLSYGLVAPAPAILVAASSAIAPIEFIGKIYDQDNKLMGELTFTKADFDDLPQDKLPTDKEGNPLTELVLHPKQEITFTFKDMLFFSVTIEGWGEIVGGGDDDIIP